MARLWSSGAELGDNTAGSSNREMSNVSTTNMTNTTNVRSGSYSWETTGTTGSREMIFYNFKSAATSAEFFARAYIMITDYPGSLTSIMGFNDSIAFSYNHIAIMVNPTGTLELWNVEDNTQIGSDSSILSLNTWYRLELKADMTTPSSSAIEARIDGASFASGTVNLANGAMSLIMGSPDFHAQNYLFDDIAINDSTGSFQNSYPGSGRIIHLRPNAAGDSNQLDDADSTNYQKVDEVTPDDVITRINTQGSATNDIDDYNIDATPSSMDKDDTINCVQVGIRRGAAGSSVTDTIVLRIKATSGGTVEESAAMTPNSSSFVTNTNDIPRNYALTLYDLPGASTTAWTKATLDTAQIGVRKSADSSLGVYISTVWLLVDYSKPASDLPVTEGLYFHLDATKQVYSDAGVTASINGGTIQQWNDLVYGNQAVQTTGNKQPLFRSSGINSIGSVDFIVLPDGFNDCLVTPSLTFGAFTQFVVFKLSGTAGIIIERGVGGGGDYIYGTTGNTIQVTRSASSGKNLSSNWATDDVTHVVTRRFDGTHTGHKLWIAGIEQTLTTGTSAGNPGTSLLSLALNIGARNNGGSIPSNGYIGEIIIYSYDLSDADRALVENYLSDKWTGSVPPVESEFIPSMMLFAD